MYHSLTEKCPRVSIVSVTNFSKKPPTMIPSCHSWAPRLPLTTNNHHLSDDLPACLHTSDESRKCSGMNSSEVASKQESPQQEYVVPSPACQKSCFEWRAGFTTTSTYNHDEAAPDDPGAMTRTHDDGDHKIKSAQRMRGNIHQKRGAWRQMALRTRQGGAKPHHQEKLQILNLAAQRASCKAAHEVDRHAPSVVSDQFIPIHPLLNQVDLCNMSSMQLNTNTPSGSTPTIMIDTTLDTDTAVKRVQAYHLGLNNRCHLHGSKQQGATEPLHNGHEISIIGLPSVSEIQPPMFERQVSNITMSDLDDSAHHCTWWSTSLSSVNRSRSWDVEEGIEEDYHKDLHEDDNLFMPDEPVRRSCESKNNNCHSLQLHFDVTKSTGEFQNLTWSPPTRRVRHDQVSSTVPSTKLPCSPRHHSSWSTMKIQINDSPEHMQRTTAMDRSSLRSCLKPPLESDFGSMQPNNLPTLVEGSTSTHHPSRHLDDFLDTMRKGDDDDDDVSCTQSFFEEESRVEKASLNLKSLYDRWEGTLDFRSTLQRRAANFYNLNGTIPPSCFNFSLTVNSTSRWDDGLPDPSHISHLTPKDELSKAAVSTYMQQVRQPPQKLSPSDVIALTSNMGNGIKSSYDYSPRSTIFSSRESTETSPRMPLRKASSHSTTHPTFPHNEGGRSHQSLMPVPPLTGHEC